MIFSVKLFLCTKKRTDTKAISPAETRSGRKSEIYFWQNCPHQFLSGGFY